MKIRPLAFGLSVIATIVATEAKSDLIYPKHLKPIAEEGLYLARIMHHAAHFCT
jgi:hypothetical protein